MPLKPKMDTLPNRMKSKIKYHRLHDAQTSKKVVRRNITHSEISRVGKYQIIFVSVKITFFIFNFNQLI